MGERAVFFDRDGTLIEHYDYLSKPEQVQLLAHTGAALRRLKAHGYRLVVVTNQSAVARGMVTERTLGDIHDRLKALLVKEGAYLDGVYYCPYHPEAVVDKYKQQSELRKPAPGMLELAAADHGLDLAQSWMVGDELRDVEAGQRAGCRTVLLDSRPAPASGRTAGQVEPNFRAVNLQEAANLIIRHGANGRREAVGGVAETDKNEPARTAAVGPVVQSEAAAEPGGVVSTAPSQTADESKGPRLSRPAERQQDAEAGVGEAREPTGAESGGLAEQVRHSEIARRKARLHRRQAKPSDGAGPSSEESPGNEALLRQILRELKHFNRRESFTEFSIPKLVAGITQMLVVLCLILAFMFHAGDTARPGAVQNCLLLGLTFQTMTLTLMLMHRQS